MPLNASKTVNFTDTEGLTEKFWARVDVEAPKSETVTLTEAATVIDSIYDLDSCYSDDALSGGFPAIDIEPEDVPVKLSAAFGQIDYDPCKFDSGTFNYKTSVYVYRSHLTIPYKLVINDGAVIRTQKITKRIRTVVKPEENIIEVNYPISGNLVCEKAVRSYKGATIVLAEDYGQHLEILYDTTYDKVDITVFGTEDNQNAVAIAFYNGLAYTEDIKAPEEDALSVATIGCKGTITTDTEEEEEEEDGEAPEVCYQRYIYSKVCSCSGDIHSSYSEVVEVPCPDSPATPHSDTEQGALNFWWQAKDIITYVDCPDEIWEGHDPAFYLDKCCVPWHWYDGQLPTCEERTQSWPGGKGIINGPEYYKALNNQTVTLVAVPPEDGNCGTIVTKWKVTAKNCCDPLITPPIVYDNVNSADTISDYSSGVIFWEGGSGTFSVKIRGQGFYLDRAKTTQDLSGITNQAVRIWTADACGCCDITITDGCSEATGLVRSTTGNWVGIGADSPACNDFPLTLCSSFGGWRDSGELQGPQGDGRYAVQVGSTAAGTIGQWTMARVSYVCGLWGGPGATSHYVTLKVPSKYPISFLALKSFGEGSCVPFPPDNWAKLYWFTPQVHVYEWRC